MGIAGEQFHNHTYNILKVDTPVPEKIVTHIASDLKSSKNGNGKESSEAISTNHNTLVNFLWSENA